MMRCLSFVSLEGSECIMTRSRGEGIVSSLLGHQLHNKREREREREIHPRSWLRASKHSSTLQQASCSTSNTYTWHS